MTTDWHINLDALTDTHLFDACIDDHTKTPESCRAAMTARCERDRLKRIAELAIERQERREGSRAA